MYVNVEYHDKLGIFTIISPSFPRLSFFTVAPRYNEDPVITNNIWKPGRITVKYVETNPAITSPAITKTPL